MLSKQGEIRRDEACLDYAGTQIILYPCHGSKGNQFWEYNDEVSKMFLSGAGIKILFMHQIMNIFIFYLYIISDKNTQAWK